MGLTDILVVLAVFAGFGLLILSRLKEKNPERHAALIEFFKGMGTVKEKFKPKQEGVQPIVLPESARIM